MAREEKRGAVGRGEGRRERDVLFHSHNFLRQISAFDVRLLTIGPGTKIRQTRKMMTPGMTSPATMRSHVGIFSFSTYGNEMDRSRSEKGR